MRSLVRSSVLLVLVAAAGVAHADKPQRLPLEAVPTPDEKFVAGGDAAISEIIFVNRCVGGCPVIKGANNSLANESSLPGGNDGSQYTVTEFAHGDAVWQQVLDCVRETYAPFNVTVTDQDPSPMPHHEAIAAGLYSDIAFPYPVGGVATSGGCDPRNNVISFSFLNSYSPSDIIGMCSTIAQESAHSFGLPDHLYDCTDPMTYLTIGDGDACGAQFFRNRLMRCGEFQENVPACQCGGAFVNSHVVLASVFGESGYQWPAPTVALAYPEDGQTITGTTPFQVTGDARRGIYNVELYFNGWLWATWTAPPVITQWPPANYLLEPADFPDGVIDVEVRAYDDLGTMGSTTIQVTKGAPCGSAADCADGQQCEAGKCFWDQPTGELGDACDYDQFCVGPNTYDGRCESDGTSSICTRGCFSGVNDDCPEGFSCLETNSSTGEGVCWFASEDPGGCCDAGGRRGSRGSVTGPILLAFAVAGLLFARRRRA